MLVMILLFAVTGLPGCKKKNPEPADTAGRITFLLKHRVDGAPLVRNEMKYTNAAGNPYMITELKYFLSEIRLYRSGGGSVLVDNPGEIFYVDEDIPSTMTIRVLNSVPAGTYDSVSFIFGIPGDKNKSHMYVNPPEALMGWPEVLGGGYHYMMMNGRWQDTAGIVQPFNFHLGIGQLYHGQGYNVDSIYAFVQNYFRVSLPGSSFTLNDQEELTLGVVMNIESWFSTPHVYDHNYWGGGIMQNQAAMLIAKENGFDVFTFELPLTKKQISYGKTWN